MGWKSGKHHRSVGPDNFDFADAIDEVLDIDIMQNTVVPILTDTIKEVARTGQRQLRGTSPYRTGEYAKGWAVKFETKRLSAGAIIYGKDPTFRMAHLLENGHLMRNGKRSRPIKHIEPVAEWANTEVVNLMYKKLESV